jgi:hypothetical protein
MLAYSLCFAFSLIGDIVLVLYMNKFGSFDLRNGIDEKQLRKGVMVQRFAAATVLLSEVPLIVIMYQIMLQISGLKKQQEEEMTATIISTANGDDENQAYVVQDMLKSYKSGQSHVSSNINSEI